MSEELKEQRVSLFIQQYIFQYLLNKTIISAHSSKQIVHKKDRSMVHNFRK